MVVDEIGSLLFVKYTNVWVRVCVGVCGCVCVGVRHYNDMVGFDGDAPSTVVTMTKRW